MVAATRAARIETALARALDEKAYVTDDARAEIRICAGTVCHASGRVALREAIAEELARRSLDKKVRVVETGCHGFCGQGPIVVVQPHGIFYPRLKPRDIAEIVETSVVGDGVVERLLYRDPATDEPRPHEKDIDFYKQQEQVVLALNGKIDPHSIDDYLARGGYSSLAKVLTDADPEGVIATIQASGLRGRGGAGFATGEKWRRCRDNPGDRKYVVCNGDEGDPGAFNDRSVLEGNPHVVIEGMIIAAFAVGAYDGHVYARYEYPFAVERLAHALGQARERGLLGENILESGFDFEIRITRGAGAFVCGESTALMAAIEGLPGMPRGRHIRSVARGLHGQPTNVNNVETYANVPWIVGHGARAYAASGTGTSKGTKVFSLTGNVRNVGLAEVPMGATLRHVIFDIGGGIRGGHEFKAVKLGGPSGGCLPAGLLDTEIDYESLVAAGTTMCSGGMVIVDDATCMVDFTMSSLQFTASESCGKCVPCRVGTQRMLEILERITAGDGTTDDLERLERLSDDITEGSLCGLGDSAPNLVLTTLRHFRDEYLAHVIDGRCPAKVCRPLIRYKVNKENCTGCYVCNISCPVNAISGERKKVQRIDQRLCTRCDTCRQVCNFEAIDVETGVLATAAGRSK